MILCRRWLLILSVLVLGSGPLFAASREDRAFAAASAAFQDGIYDRAEVEFDLFVQEFPKSSRMSEAVLLQAQAQIKQGKNTAAIGLLTAPPAAPGKLADRYAYWLGEAQFAQGDYDRASETFVALTKNFPESPLRLTALIEAVTAFQRLGDWPRTTALLGDANGVFARLAAHDSTNELVSRGWLLLAQAQLAQENFAAAGQTLQRLNPSALTPALDWQRANLLCRIQVGAGDWEAALETTTNLLLLARTQDAARLADSVAWRGTVLERLGRWADAAEVWTQNLTTNSPPEWQREAVLRLAGAAVAQKKFAEAEAALGKYLTQFSNAPAADLAVLTLGELHLREYVADATATNQLAQAQARFDQFLNSSNFPAAAALAGKALLDRGWCFWLAGKMAADSGDTNTAAEKITNSLADFSAAVVQLPFSEDLAVARFKSGDAMFMLKDFAGARQNYQAVLDQFGNVPTVMQSLGDRALYQILRSSLELKDAAGADMAMRQMLAKYPASDLADNSLLLLGEGFSEMGSTTNALKVFRDFAALFPESPLTPEVELAKARTYEREQDWPAAVANYESWLKSFPTNELRPQVVYALGRACFQAGDETNAFIVYTNFVARYPSNELAPLAQWWIADDYFRQGGTNFSAAEKNYELIFQTPAWQQSDLYFPAQLMAGRAAAGRLGFADAAHYLTRLLGDTNCPAPLKTQAMFAYGGVLMRMDSPDTNRPFANFELATNVFAQLYLANVTNDTGVLACSELGDCYLQLGAFDAATNAYTAVMNSPYAGVGLRSRAQVGLGRVLEKMSESAAPDARKALLALALQNYLDVLYSDPAAADPFWTKKAGLLALPLMITLKTGDVDKFIDRLEYWLPQLKDTLEKKRAALKN
jgi:TolA-binding protein